MADAKNNGKALSPGKVAAERLRVAAFVIDKMRACVPEGGGPGPGTVIGSFANGHEEMVQALIAALRPFVPGVKVTIEGQHMTPEENRTLVCEWRPKEMRP